MLQFACSYGTVRKRSHSHDPLHFKMYAFVYIHICIHLYVCIYEYMYMRMYVLLCKSFPICIYMHIHMYLVRYVYLNYAGCTATFSTRNVLLPDVDDPQDALSL